MKLLAALLTLAWSVAPAAEAVLSRDAIEAALAVAPAPAGEMKTRGLRIQARSEEARSEEHRGAVDLQIAFALNSAALLPQARQQLGELAGALQSPRLAGRRFEVAGHTDSSGSASAIASSRWLERQRCVRFWPTWHRCVDAHGGGARVRTAAGRT